MLYPVFLNSGWKAVPSVLLLIFAFFVFVSCIIKMESILATFLLSVVCKQPLQTGSELPGISIIALLALAKKHTTRPKPTEGFTTRCCVDTRLNPMSSLFGD